MFCKQKQTTWKADKIDVPIVENYGMDFNNFLIVLAEAKQFIDPQEIKKKRKMYINIKQT